MVEPRGSRQGIDTPETQAPEPKKGRYISQAAWEALPEHLAQSRSGSTKKKG